MVGQTKKTPNVEEFKSMLKKHSLKATPQRIAVHQAMMVLGHASADMVCEAIGTEKSITTASVYNILTQLADLGIYQRRLSANNKMYFDINTNKHIHFYDIEGNEFKDVMEDDILAAIEAKLLKKRFKGYTIDSVDIQIVGHPTKKKVSASQ